MYSNYITTSSPETTILSSGANVDAGAGIWTIIAAVLAIIGGILVYFLFVKAKQEPKGKFLQWLKGFLDFKIMWIETIMKVFYYIATIFVVLFSFVLIGTSFVAFILTLVLGPIFVRLVYEMVIMFIMIWSNTRYIAKNIGDK